MGTRVTPTAQRTHARKFIVQKITQKFSEIQFKIEQKTLSKFYDFKALGVYSFFYNNKQKIQKWSEPCQPSTM